MLEISSRWKIPGSDFGMTPNQLVWTSGNKLGPNSLPIIHSFLMYSLTTSVCSLGDRMFSLLGLHWHLW